MSLTDKSVEESEKLNINNKKLFEPTFIISGVFVFF